MLHARHTDTQRAHCGAHLLPVLALSARRMRKKMGRHGIQSAKAVPNICQMAPVSVAFTAPNSTPACAPAAARSADDRERQGHTGAETFVETMTA